MKGKLEIPARIKTFAGNTVNLSHPLELAPVSNLNGPGTRLIFWVQGCSLRCTPHCLNPHNLVMKLVEPVSLKTMLDFISRKISSDRSIEGITWLGGEPFDQALSLAKVAWGAKELGLSVVTYTGYLLEDLLKEGTSEDLALLSQTDILIDGPYIEAEASVELLWRGSANQRILCLNKDFKRKNTSGDLRLHKGLELNWSPDDKVMVSGFQQTEVVDSFIKVLQAHGISLKVTR